VKLSDGTKVTLDQAAYGKYRTASNRADRKLVFDAFWPSFSAFQGTFGATLTTQVQGEVFDAKVRHFPDSLADATFADNMPEASIASSSRRPTRTCRRSTAIWRCARRRSASPTICITTISTCRSSICRTRRNSRSRNPRRSRSTSTSVYGPEYTGSSRRVSPGTG
jgi:hypothetical protein